MKAWKIFSVRVIWLVFLTGWNACTIEDEGIDSSKLFHLLPSSHTGIDFSNELTSTPEFNIVEYLNFYNGAGVAIGDINNDGLPDLYFASNQNHNKLYLNKGNLEFEDITQQAGLAGKGNWTTGVTMADVNADGYLDIYVCQLSQYKGREGKNQLYINNGDLTFTDKANELGLDFEGYSTQAAFFDYDRDGDLDMFLLNHSMHSSRSYGEATLRYEIDPLAGDKLFRNNLAEGGSGFTDVTQQAGIYSSQIGYGLGVSIGDLNSDGCPDIYVANDFHENDYIYYNNCDGTFSEGLERSTGHTSRFSMGNDIGDFNNDGRPDIVVLDMLPEDEYILKTSESIDRWHINDIRLGFGYGHQYQRNTLQLNMGGELFSEIGFLAGIAATDWSWAPLLFDMNNDGFKDIFVTNGIYRRPNDIDYLKYTSNPQIQKAISDGMTNESMDIISLMPSHKLKNYAFRNNGNLTFADSTDQWGFTQRSYSNGAAYGDLDNDGDLDIVANNIGENAFIYENTISDDPTRHFLRIILKGGSYNSGGIGARILTYTDGNLQLHEHYPTRGFMSSVDHVIVVGLGEHATVDSLITIWPGNKVKKSYNVQADQTLIISEKNASPGSFNLPDHKPSDLFSNITQEIDLDYRHVENDFNDFKREHLLPHKLSTEGPCLAKADVNNDGLDDLYIGGSAIQPGKLFIQRSPGSFEESNQALMYRDRFHEDVACVFFDFENDGDMDLFVVSGGSEYTGENYRLRDRLYLNDGKGSFTLFEEGVPQYIANGSTVAAADFDNDGDVDLFVGSRSVIGRYGLDPRHFLLINQSGTFKVSDQSFEEAGMVTDAVWSDYDRDGDLDLFLVGEWMPVTLYTNDNGRLVHQRLKGLENTAGWWFSLTAVDINQDGFDDLVVGNVGENNIHKPTVAQPLKIFVKDFDENGSVDPLICYYKDNSLYPIATKEEIVTQIPSLKKRFVSSKDYAGKSIYDIFDKDQLDAAFQKEVHTFSHTILINNEGNGFTNRSMPVIVQAAPLQDVVSGDFNQDGYTDLVVGGNFFPVKPYFGRYDASYGFTLFGNGEGGFSAAGLSETGLILNGDVRALTLMTIGHEPVLLSVLNNDYLRIFKITNKQWKKDHLSF